MPHIDPLSLEYLKSLPPEDVARLAAKVVFADVKPEYPEAIFVHGLPSIDDDINNATLHMVAKYHAQHFRPPVIINGMRRAECIEKTHGYLGSEIFRSRLNRFDVDPGAIGDIEPSQHVGEELFRLLLLAQERGLQNVVITTLEHHQERSFRQIVALMKHVGEIKVYNMPYTGMSLARSVRRPVKGGVTVHGAVANYGALITHYADERKRQKDYEPEPPVVGGKPKYTQHASDVDIVWYAIRRDLGNLDGKGR